MKINIFLNSYQQAENKLTYNFLAVLEILNDKDFCEFLTKEGLKERPISNIKTVYGGGKSNPDGSFDLHRNDGSLMTVYFENKTKRRGVSVEQLKGHLKLCREGDLLLVITPRKSDIDAIKSINDNRIKIFTWAEISAKLKKANNEIANQFIEYGQLSGEFEELGEIHKSDIDFFCNYFRSNFDNKINNILEHFHYDVDLSKFGFNVKKRRNFDWGRRGTEFNVEDYFTIDSQKYMYGQFLTIAYYHNIYDHKIALKKNEPEIVAFFDIFHDKRSLIENDESFKKIIDDLVELGFESNLNMKISSNPWRLFCYRKPLSEFNEISVLSLLQFTEEVFGKILQTNALEHKYFNQMTN